MSTADKHQIPETELLPAMFRAQFNACRIKDDYRMLIESDPTYEDYFLDCAVYFGWFMPLEIYVFARHGHYRMPSILGTSGDVAIRKMLTDVRQRLVERQEHPGLILEVDWLLRPRGDHW